MVGYKDHKTYGDCPFMRTHQVINQHTPYKLKEIIRDIGPQLYYLKKEINNGRINTTTTNEGGSMSSMTGLKRDRAFVFVGWSGLLLLPTAYLAIGGLPLARRCLLQFGIPTDWGVFLP